MKGFGFDDLFGDFGSMPVDPSGHSPEVVRARESVAARKGVCPAARACADLNELARWFDLAGTAAGALVVRP